MEHQLLELGVAGIFIIVLMRAVTVLYRDNVDLRKENARLLEKITPILEGLKESLANLFVYLRRKQ